MTMECDTRLAMMTMRDRAQTKTQTAPRRPTHAPRRFNTTLAASTAAAMAAFALNLFTRTS